jgi:hypothetical protein
MGFVKAMMNCRVKETLEISRVTERLKVFLVEDLFYEFVFFRLTGNGAIISGYTELIFCSITLVSNSRYQTTEFTTILCSELPVGGEYLLFILRIVEDL